MIERFKKGAEMVKKHFDFRESLITSNKSITFTFREKEEKEISLLKGVIFEGDTTKVVEHAKNDFFDFLKVGFGIESAGDNPINIHITITQEGLEDVCDYKGRIVDIQEGKIDIYAYDERGAAQAIYDLEDMMSSKKQPYLDKGRSKNKPLFSPRMVHSAYGVNIYPEGYIQKLAKEGVDAIILSITGVNEGIRGPLDTNAIIDLAEEYGMDVYGYWSKYIFHSPEAEDAEDVYYAAYGAPFKAHNKLKGIILVGESVQFPSKDERTTGDVWWNYVNEDNFPNPKPAPGMFPCNDYPQWLDLVKRVIRKEKEDAEIIFWTYNWGWVDEKTRVELLENLPTDISLLVTFEMFENLPTQYGITERVCDYSVAFAGPGKYFTSEAEVAKRRGIKLYTQANAGGRTWDFGCLTYEPFPQQWQDRYRALRDCKEKYNLSGIMETHHYGFWPSFITKIEKKSYEYIRQSDEEILKEVVEEFSNGETEKCIEAFDYWSQAIRMYMPTDNEQYGAMRVGTAYPLMLNIFPRPPVSLNVVERHDDYTWEYACPSPALNMAEGKFTLHGIRIRIEIKILRDIIKLIRKGISLLKTVKEKSEEIVCLINMAEYMVCCFTTDIHVKQMYIYRHRLLITSTKKEMQSIISGIKKVANAEIKNSERSLKCVDQDSAIGFEPCMGYAGDRIHIEWKIRQVKHMLKYELSIYENALNLY